MIQNRKPRRRPEEEHGSDGVHHDVRYPQLYLPTTRQRPNLAPPFTLVDSDEIAGTNFLAHGGEGDVFLWASLVACLHLCLMSAPCMVSSIYKASGNFMLMLNSCSFVVRINGGRHWLTVYEWCSFLKCNPVAYCLQYMNDLFCLRHDLLPFFCPCVICCKSLTPEQTPC